MIDILSGYPSLLTSSHFDLLVVLLLSPWSDERYQRLLHGDFDFDSVRYAQLLLALCEEKTEWLMQYSDSRCKDLLLRLCGILTANGYPVVEDKVFVSAVEFWSTFTEAMADVVHADDLTATPWAEPVLSHILEAVSHAWRKLRYPPFEEFAIWDSSERISFMDVRKDAVDLLQSVYSLSGPKLAMTFADLVIAALNDSSWLDLEAAAFCLGGLADCIREDSHIDQTLSPVFSSSLFADLKSPEIPLRVRQTCLSLIEQYTEYFERNLPALAPALRILFSLLEEKSMAPAAAKSVFRLCSSCRHHLYPEASGFLDQYHVLSQPGLLDCMSSEKVLGAIACVAQAIPDSFSKFDACSRLLSFLQQDLILARRLSTSVEQPSVPCHGHRCSDKASDEHPGLHIALKVLRGLVSLGKGLQSPPDAIIDLDAKGHTAVGFEHHLDSLHKQVMGIIIDAERSFGQNPEVLELICSALRSGFSESEPGAFVLGMEDVTEYLSSHTNVTQRPGLFVATASSFVSSLHSQKHSGTDVTFISLLSWVVGLLRQLPGMIVFTFRTTTVG